MFLVSGLRSGRRDKRQAYQGLEERNGTLFGITKSESADSRTVGETVD